MENTQNNQSANDSYSLRDFCIFNGASGKFFPDVQPDKTTGRSYFVFRFVKPGKTKEITDSKTGEVRVVDDTLDFSVGKRTEELEGVTPDKMTCQQAREWLLANQNILKARKCLNSKGEECKMATLFTGRVEGDCGW